MKRVAIIQARTGSTRLPGKVLLPLGGTTVLGCVVDRLQACTQIAEIVVATTTLAGDDAVESEAARLKVGAFRGASDDVLERFCAAAQACGADIVVRITADCPLIDGALVDCMMMTFDERQPECDYLSNTIARTFPRGLDAEIFTYAALKKAAEEADEPYQREHVTPYLYQHPELFAISQYTDPAGEDHSSMRWTLDTPEDFTFLQAVYAACPHGSPRDITTAEVLNALARDPTLLNINRHVRQKTLGE